MVNRNKKKTVTRSSRAAISSTKKRATDDKRRAHGRSSSKASRKVSREVGLISQPKSPMPAQHQQKPGLESKLKPRPRYQAPYYKGSEKLRRKVALITGGDSGIGRAVAVLFAREGADVAITYLPDEQSDAEETREAVAAEGRDAHLIAGDLTDPDFCKEAVEATVSRFGKLDILVNNAAFQQHQKSLAKVSEEQWDRTFQTNIYSYFRITKAALPHLKKGSSIVNCGSITGLEGSKHLLDYSATKGAIHAFTKSLAQNLVEKGIRVNCVAPGPVWTPLNPSDKPAKDVAEFGADTPMKRPAQPEEIAPAFVYFASEVDSSYVTGEVLTLLGGETTAG
ncbi:MAG: SDR family oxidoreductase [Pyrinomonadaceae bacterium]|nr:SDR family oxidoreductase [Pyrinomonadaceae bacterium]